MEVVVAFVFLVACVAVGAAAIVFKVSAKAAGALCGLACTAVLLSYGAAQLFLLG